MNTPNHPHHVVPDCGGTLPCLLAVLGVQPGHPHQLLPGKQRKKVRTHWAARSDTGEPEVCWKDMLYQVLSAWATEGDTEALGIPVSSGWAVWGET